MRLSNSLSVIVMLILSCQNEVRDSVTSSEQAALPDTLQLVYQSDSLFEVAVAYDSMNMEDSAAHFYEQSLGRRLKAGIIDQRIFQASLRLARLFHSVFKYDVADHYYDQARMLMDSVEVPPVDKVSLLLYASMCKANLRNVEPARSLALQALSITDEYLPGNTGYLRLIYTAMATAYYYERDFKKATEQWKKAVAYIGPDSHGELARTYSNMGMASMALGEDKNAMRYYDSSIYYSLKSGNLNSDQLAGAYLQKSFLGDLVEPDQALFYRKENLRIRSGIYGNKSSSTWGAKLSLGELFESLGQYDSAIAYYQDGLTSLIRNFESQDPGDNPSPDPTEVNNELVMALTAKGSALQKLGDARADDLLLALSLNTYELADSVFKVFMGSFVFDDPQLRQLDTEYIPYEEMLALSFELYEHTGHDQYLQKSLDIMEGSRAQLLSRALMSADQFGTLGLPEDKLQEMKELTVRRSEILRVLGTSSNSKKSLDSLSEILLEVDNRFEGLQSELGSVNQTYSIAKTRRSVDLSEVQAFMASQNRMLIEYLWGKDALRVIAIGADSVRIETIVLTPELSRHLNIFTSELTMDPSESYKQEHFQQFIESAHYLCRKLLQPVLPAGEWPKGGLTISGDGPLATFPFEALITAMPKSREVDYRLPYLMDNTAISYTNSTSILMQQSKQLRSGNKLLALGFAGSSVDGNTRSNLAGLPGTEQEIMSIKEIMKNHVNLYFLASDASEANFKKLVPRFDIAHLAIHGIADSTNALESRLVFRSEEDTLDDGNLYAHELYDLDLSNLDLAVLSACESGIGKRQTGEGVMSIARGFAYAGCPTQIISLWKIDDRTTASVMGNFYKHLSSEEELNGALSSAKREYVSTAGELRSHPFYWAAFLQVGDPRPIVPRDYLTLYLVIGMSTILLGFILFLAAKRKARG